MNYLMIGISAFLLILCILVFGLIEKQQQLISRFDDVIFVSMELNPEEEETT
jgi:hypothetical protein